VYHPSIDRQIARSIARSLASSLPDMSIHQLPHLETFALAAELSSFTAAARALNLTQAAVSQRIAALEADLGVPLFHRQGGRVLLTEAGRQLHDYSTRIFALHQEARAQVTGKTEPLTGELSLAASSIPGEHLLPGLLSVFQQQYPHIQVKAAIADSQAALEQVEQGVAHLGLVGRKGDSPHLDYHSFAGDRMVLVVPANHPLAGSSSVRLAQLCELPLVLREAGSGSRWCLEQALARAGKSLHDLHVVLELGSNEAIKETVLRGPALAVLSTYAVHKEVQAGRLHPLDVTGLPMQREMFAVRDRRRVLPIPARLFLAMLESWSGEVSSAV
jgi:DNA-binding transcriptional LysR family regulator